MGDTNKKHEIKKLLDRGKEIRGLDNNLEKMERITEVIRMANGINSDYVNNPRLVDVHIALMDAHVIRMGHTLAGETIQKIQNTNFSEKEYISLIKKNVYKETREKWDNIAEIAKMVSKSIRAPCIVLGSFEDRIDRSERTQSQRRKRDLLEKEKNPEMIETASSQRDNQTKIRRIWKKIKEIYINRGENPIPFYELILDPNSFVNTIDNAFQIAFLINNNNVMISTGPDGLPVVQPVTENDKRTSSAQESVQAICSLKFKDYQDRGNHLLEDMQEGKLKFPPFLQPEKVRKQKMCKFLQLWKHPCSQIRECKHCAL